MVVDGGHGIYRLPFGVVATEDFEEAWGEALHAEAYSVDANLGKALEEDRGELFRVGFKGDFYIGRMGACVAGDGVDELLEVVYGIEGGGSPSEIEGDEAAPVEEGAPDVPFGKEGCVEGIFIDALVGEDEEVAIRAFALAEG